MQAEIWGCLHKSLGAPPAKKFLKFHLHFAAKFCYNISEPSKGSHPAARFCQRGAGSRIARFGTLAFERGK